jgi:hypothetical protein
MAKRLKLSGQASFNWTDDDGRSWRLTLDPLPRGGRYVYDRIVVESTDEPPVSVTKKALKSMPLQEFKVKDEDQRRSILAELAKMGRASATAELHAARAPRAGGFRDEHWQAVADVYRAAADKPTKTVQAYLSDVLGKDVPHGTAARHVARARERGFLEEPSTPYN